MLTDRGVLRKLMKEKKTLLTIGVGDAFSAKIASETDGVDAILSSGFSVSACSMALPDAELYTRSDNVYAVSNMCYISEIPVIADIDTGYGNAVTIIKSVNDFERAGASAVIIEDQISPKKCPICVDPKGNIISAEEAAGKIKSAVENRLYPETVIIARCDAINEEELYKRCKMYLDAGADLVQPISAAFNKDIDKYSKFAEQFEGKVSMIVVGWLDELTKEEILKVGPKLVQFALVPINAYYPAVKKAIEYVGENFTQVGINVEKANHHELVKFLGMPKVEELERKYLQEY